MKPVLEWLDDEVTVSNGLHLRLCPSEERQEWDWYAYDLQGLELGTGTDDGRGVEHAKAQAETFAREWIASQAAALSPGEWTSALPTVNGWYWVNTGTVVGIETVRPRLELLTTVTARFGLRLRTLGEVAGHRRTKAIRRGL